MQDTNPTAGRITVWCLTDRKAGHENQLRGLARALGQLVPAQVEALIAPGPWPSAAQWLRRGFPAGAALPDPDLILAAGHRTHLAALAARRARGGKLVVLMKPTLPAPWFDLCLVPDHDPAPAGHNVIITRGVINNVTPVPASTHAPDRGLFLIGGPSAHHHWDDAATARQIGEIVRRDANQRWRLTTSRRTPATCLAHLPRSDRLEVVPVEQTPPGWVPEQLAVASQVWVTEDSASMVYEALTAGAAVGVLPVARRHASRVALGLDRLVAERWVTPYAAWRDGTLLQPPPEPLDEAARCARLVAERFLQGKTCR